MEYLRIILGEIAKLWVMLEGSRYEKLGLTQPEKFEAKLEKNM